MLIPRQIFNVAKLASRESTRYAINGVRVERENGHCKAITTDGRRLIVAQWSDEADRPEYPASEVGSVEPTKGFAVTVPTDLWVEAGKLIPKRTCKPVLDNCLLDETLTEMRKTDKGMEQGTEIHFAATNLERTFTTRGPSCDGAFPKYQDVMPDYTIRLPDGDGGCREAIEIGVNPVLLAEILQTVARIATNEECKGVRLIVPMNPNRPIVVEAETCEGVSAKAVLMPVALPKREAAAAVRAAARADREAASAANPAESVEDDASEPEAPTEAPNDGTSASDTEDVGNDAPEPNTKRVKVRLLRKNPDKHAPVSGLRCRVCGASAWRAQFPADSEWLVVNGAVYCPACEKTE